MILTYFLRNNRYLTQKIWNNLEKTSNGEIYKQFVFYCVLFGIISNRYCTNNKESKWPVSCETNGPSVQHHFSFLRHYIYAIKC